MSVVTYAENLDPRDQANQFEFIRDDGTRVIIERGLAYDLSNTEQQYLRRFLRLTAGGANVYGPQVVPNSTEINATILQANTYTDSVAATKASVSVESGFNSADPSSAVLQTAAPFITGRYRLRDHWSAGDFGALGKGDDYTGELTEAIQETRAASRVLHVAEGVYGVSSKLTGSETTPLTLRGAGKGATIFEHGASGLSMFDASGSFIATGVTLTAPAAVGAVQITLTSTTGIAPKDLLLLRDQTAILYSNDHKTQVACGGEWVRVRSIDSTTQLTLWGRLKRAYTIGSDLRKAAQTRYLTFENFTIANAAPGSMPVGSNGITIVGGERLRLRNLEFRDMDANCLYLQTCFDAEVVGSDFYDSRDLESGLNPYSLILKNGTQHVVMRGCRQRYGRHLITTGPSGDTLEIPSADVLVDSCIATEMSQAAFDTHPGSERFVFANCVAHACLDKGFQLRGPRCSVINPHVFGATIGVLFVYGADEGIVQGGILGECDTGVRAQDSTDCMIRNVHIRKPVVGGIHVQAASYVEWTGYIDRFTAEDVRVTGSPSDAAFAFDQWSDNYVLSKLRAPDAAVKVRSVSPNTPTTYGLDGDGFPGVLAPTAAGSARGSVTLVANRAWLVRFVAPRNMVATKLTFVVTTAATADDAVDVGICGPSATPATITLLGSKGATTGLLNSLGLRIVTLPAPLKLVGGTVYYGALSCGAIGGAAATISGVGMNNTTVNQLIGSSPPLMIAGSKDSSHPLPAAIGGPSQQLLGPSMGILE